MPSIAEINDILSATNQASDLATWTKITPSTAGARDGVFIANRSSLYLWLAYASTAVAAPTGSAIADANGGWVAPGETVVLEIGSAVDVYGLHSATGAGTGCTLLERA